MRKVVVFVVVLVVAAGAAFVGAGYSSGPAIQIVKPDKFVGVTTPVEVAIDTPRGALSTLTIEFEQQGNRTQIVSLASPTLVGVTGDHVTLTRAIAKDVVPTLATGPGRIIVTAARPVLFGWRHVQSQVTRDVEVRLERPRVSVVSTHHYVNLGGAEMIVYRVSPADVASGVRVGELEYPGFPAAGAATAPGAQVSDPALRIAFFALRYDQPLDTMMYLFARDAAGNEARGDFDYRTFPKPFKQSRIDVTDKLLDRVVPAILAGTKEIAPTGALIDQYVAINGDLRKKNAAKIASFATDTARELLWKGDVFYPFTNSATESAFADQRTYIYQGREVDKQVHLGFDLASFAGTPILAANRGKVLFAEELGIYGNCVIIDHGFGVQSLYAHLSVIDVKPGTVVEKAQPIGKSGMTGLAGGDHLHFTMLVNGQMVNPIEWWDAHWIEDRILRKLKG